MKHPDTTALQSLSPDQIETLIQMVRDESGNSFFTADYHQQYLAKNPQGYCGLQNCGVRYVTPEG